MDDTAGAAWELFWVLGWIIEGAPHQLPDAIRLAAALQQHLSSGGQVPEKGAGRLCRRLREVAALYGEALPYEASFDDHLSHLRTTLEAHVAA